MPMISLTRQGAEEGPGETGGAAEGPQGSSTQFQDRIKQQDRTQSPCGPLARRTSPPPCARFWGGGDAECRSRVSVVKNPPSGRSSGKAGGSYSGAEACPCGSRGTKTSACCTKLSSSWVAGIALGLVGGGPTGLIP